MINVKTQDGSQPALKRKYLECFEVRTTNAATWREVVTGLVHQGATRPMLVRWAVDAGNPRSTVSSILSRILCSLGQRERKAGAGRKPSPEALALLALARERYGKRFLKVLHAAWRAGKTREAAEKLPGDFPVGTVDGLSALPTMGRNGANCVNAIRRKVKANTQNGGHLPASVAIVFQNQ